jgi:hypothetical protein
MAGGTVLSKFNFVQTNFSKGELGAKALGNVNTEEYANSVNLLENFIPRVDGGAFKRPGTWFRGLFPQGKVPFLIPFVGSDGKRFIITIDNSGKDYTFIPSYSHTPVGFYNVEEVGPGEFILGVFESLVGTSASPNPYKAICPSLNPNGFHYAQSGNVVIVVHESGMMEPIVIKYLGNNNQYTDKFFWSYWTNVSGASALFNLYLNFRPLMCPYLDRNVSTVTFALNAVPAATLITASQPYFMPSMIGSYVRMSTGTVEGIFYITHLSSRVTATVSGINVTVASGFSPATGKEIVFHGTAYVPKPLQMGKIYYAINISSSIFKVAYTYEDAIAGNHIELGTLLSGTLYMTINEPLTTANGVTILPMPAGLGTTPTDNWTLSAWSDFQGWPKSVSFYESRLFFGGTRLQPSTLFGSLVNNIFFFMQVRLDQDVTSLDDDNAGTGPSAPSGYDFVGYIKDTDPIVFTLSTTANDNIKWLVAGRNLFVGTDQQEGTISGGDSIIGPNNVKVSFDTSVGCASLQGIKVNQSLLYVSRDNKSIRDFVYYDTNGSYVSVDISKVNDSIIFHNYIYPSIYPDASKEQTTKDIKIIQTVYDSNRATLWILTNQYQLVGVTYDRQLNTLSWHRHTLGGNPLIKSMCILQSENQNFDFLYLGTERVIDGNTVYSLERMDIDFNETNTDHGSMNYMDYAMEGRVNPQLEGLNTAGQADVGFPYHAGAVGLLCNIKGRQHTTLIEVTMGSGLYVATLDDDYTDGDPVIIGYGYDAKITLNPIQAGGDFGLSSGTLHRTDRITVRFYNSMGLKYEKENGVYVEIFDNDYTVATSGSLALFTGEKTEIIDNDHDTYNQIKFKHDIPFPCNILNIVQRGVSYGG